MSNNHRWCEVLSEAAVISFKSGSGYYSAFAMMYAPSHIGIGIAMDVTAEALSSSPAAHYFVTTIATELCTASLDAAECAAIALDGAVQELIGAFAIPEAEYSALDNQIECWSFSFQEVVENFSGSMDINFSLDTATGQEQQQILDGSILRDFGFGSYSATGTCGQSHTPQ